MVLHAIPFVHMFVRKHVGKHITVTVTRKHIGESFKLGKHLRIGRMANNRHTKYVSARTKKWFMMRRVGR